MKVNLKKITGNWDEGYVLDKHSIKSVPIGQNAYGHTQFDTLRTEVGEATFLLKNRDDFSQVQPLAQQLAKSIFPQLANVGFILPMPASKTRPRQPVTEIANALGAIVGKPVFNELLLKTPTGQSMKDMTSKAEKLEAIGNSLSISDILAGDGPWNCLLIDDLFHTGASMEKACTVLRAYPKVRKIYVAALTWRPA